MRTYQTILNNMKLYYHKTNGGAEYLFDTFMLCQDGHKEGVINDSTRYMVRIDGDITKDAELIVRDRDEVCRKCGSSMTEVGDDEFVCNKEDCGHNEIIKNQYAKRR